jgi:hypothetical protein
MKSNAWTFALFGVAALLLLVGGVPVQAQCLPPLVTPFPAPPAVTYYPPPVTYAPAVSYYFPPTVSYYAPPVVSPYPAAVVPGGAVTKTYYGLFGRPKSTTTYYYPSVYVGP